MADDLPENSQTPADQEKVTGLLFAEGELEELR